MVTRSAPDGVSTMPASRSSMASVENDFGEGPGAAVVAGANELDAAEGADVGFAAARSRRQATRRSGSGRGSASRDSTRGDG